MKKDIPNGMRLRRTILGDYLVPIPGAKPGLRPMFMSKTFAGRGRKKALTPTTAIFRGNPL